MVYGSSHKNTANPPLLHGKIFDGTRQSVHAQTEPLSTIQVLLVIYLVVGPISSVWRWVSIPALGTYSVHVLISLDGLFHLFEEKKLFARFPVIYKRYHTFCHGFTGKRVFLLKKFYSDNPYYIVRSGKSPSWMNFCLIERWQRKY